MSDDRLFASNNPIGRKWYFINLIFLSMLIVGTEILFTNYIIPDVTSEFYVSVVNFIKITIYFIYTITFFALIDRRLYDICGKRDSALYKNIFSFLFLLALPPLFTLYYNLKLPNIPIPSEILYLSSIISLFLFLLIILILGLIRGTISNLSYEEYRRKIKYNL